MCLIFSKVQSVLLQGRRASRAARFSPAVGSIYRLAVSRLMSVKEALLLGYTAERGTGYENVACISPHQ